MPAVGRGERRLARWVRALVTSGGALAGAMTVLALMGVTRAVNAQQLPSSFQLSLSNPGARSLGFGGAFVAIADDATAAWANPAGLVQLARPELCRRPL